MLGIIVVPRNAVMIQEREHLFAALLTPFLVFVRQWGGEFSLTHCRRNLIADRLCLRITTVMGCFDSALPAKRWFTTPKRHLLGLRIYKTYRCRNGQTMLPEWSSEGSSHMGKGGTGKAEDAKLQDAGISLKIAVKMPADTHGFRPA